MANNHRPTSYSQMLDLWNDSPVTITIWLQHCTCQCFYDLGWQESITNEKIKSLVAFADLQSDWTAVVLYWQMAWACWGVRTKSSDMNYMNWFGITTAMHLSSSSSVEHGNAMKALVQRLKLLKSWYNKSEARCKILHLQHSLFGVVQHAARRTFPKSSINTGILDRGMIEQGLQIPIKLKIAHLILQSQDSQALQIVHCCHCILKEGQGFLWKFCRLGIERASTLYAHGYLKTL